MIKNLKITVLFLVLFTSLVSAEDWMPDPALREAVREKLGIPADRPLTPEHLRLHLTVLVARGKGIEDLTGLEHATQLFFLDLGGNQISDISALSGLVNLELLRLGGNQISDISALSGLVNLKVLNINNNPIADISPLIGLENLEDLRIRNLDGSTIPISKLKQFGYAETCDLEAPLFWSGLRIVSILRCSQHLGILSTYQASLGEKGWCIMIYLSAVYRITRCSGFQVLKG